MKKLIGKKVYGFKFEDTKKVVFPTEMNEYIGIVGQITEYYKEYNSFRVLFFNKSFSYPADQIEAHLVEEETKPHSFCETPEEKCTMNYCDNNGCQNRKRVLVNEEPILNEIPTFTKEQVVDFANKLLKMPNRDLEAKTIEEHFKEEYNTKQNEIPTLTDGVMMLVSDDDKHYEPREVYFKYNEKYYVKPRMASELTTFLFCKPLEPTKEEQLTAILGSSEKVSEIMELFKN